MASRKRARSRSDSLCSLSAPASPFKEMELHSTFVLPPAYLENHQQGIRELLNYKLLGYDEHLGGALLSYRDIESLESHGLVFCDDPNIQFRVKFKGLFFAPSPGMELSGVITHVSAGHLGLLYAGVFQVTVQRDQIPPRYQYSSSFNHYVDENNQEDKLEEGQFSKFRVSGMNGEGSLFTIEATMLDLATRRPAPPQKSSKKSDKDNNKKKKKKSSKKKKRKSESN